MNNGIDDLFDILLEEAKRLRDIDINSAVFGNEVERAKAMAMVASQYLSGEQLKLRAEISAQTASKQITYMGE